MDKQQIALKLALNALDLSVKMDTFDDRLVLQKAVYLTQAKGVNLGYYYSWYLYGPYTSTLTRDAFSIETELQEGPDESSEWQLGKESEEKLKEVKLLIEKPPESPSLASWLELLASVHFIIKRKQVSGRNAKEIQKKLEAFEKSFSKEQIEIALKELETHGLLRETSSSQNNS